MKMENEKRNVGAPKGNKNGQLQDPTKRKNCKLTIYLTEKELMEWKKDAKERGISLALRNNMLLNKQRLPKLKTEI